MREPGCSPEACGWIPEGIQCGALPVETAGLTPEEIYLYATTGIYPLDGYFGVPASEMMAIDDIKKVRRAYADEEARSIYLFVYLLAFTSLE